MSPTLGHSIAMAVVKGGLGRMGESVFLPLRDGRTVTATICSPVFYDPKSERQNA
jgi:sarcosine oxidase subunit alpha